MYLQISYQYQQQMVEKISGQMRILDMCIYKYQYHQIVESIPGQMRILDMCIYKYITNKLWKASLGKFCPIIKGDSRDSQ